MPVQSISLWQTGLYWTLALAVVGAGAATVERDPLTEWELVNNATIELREQLVKRPRNQVMRQQLADLGVRSAVGAERALAIGNANLFDSYRRQFKELFHDSRGRIARMAKEGDAAAEYAIGVLALHGFLKAANIDAACQHFATALAAGYAGAAFRESQCLQKKDAARSGALLREAAASGHPAAAELVGRACVEAKPPDAACAWEQLSAAASAGRPSAQSLLAWMYVQGFGGRPADLPRAAQLYQQAARAGDAAAQNNVGELYETGRGVAPDPKQASDWYRRAAEAGFAPAQFNLGRLYAAGAGVPKDLAEARRWLEQAERGGIATARQALDWIEKEKAATGNSAR